MTEAWLKELSLADCVALLRSDVVGRIAFVSDGYPVMLPVNYRCVDTTSGIVLALRTRERGAVDQAPQRVAFEIDGIDRAGHRGWSVLVRGNLGHVDAKFSDLGVMLDSVPWLSEGRDIWLVIKPEEITGRRLEAATVEWAFHASAYL